MTVFFVSYANQTRVNISKLELTAISLLQDLSVEVRAMLVTHFVDETISLVIVRNYDISIALYQQNIKALEIRI